MTLCSLAHNLSYFLPSYQPSIVHPLHQFLHTHPRSLSIRHPDYLGSMLEPQHSSVQAAIPATIEIPSKLPVSLFEQGEICYKSTIANKPP